MTVKELREHFPNEIKFSFFDKDGESQVNAMLDSKIRDWLVSTDFKVTVYLA